MCFFLFFSLTGNWTADSTAYHMVGWNMGFLKGKQEKTILSIFCLLPSTSGSMASLRGSSLTLGSGIMSSTGLVLVFYLCCLFLSSCWRAVSTESGAYEKPVMGEQDLAGKQRHQA